MEKEDSWPLRVKVGMFMVRAGGNEIEESHRGRDFEKRHAYFE